MDDNYQALMITSSYHSDPVNNCMSRSTNFSESNLYQSLTFVSSSNSGHYLSRPTISNTKDFIDPNLPKQQQQQWALEGGSTMYNMSNYSKNQSPMTEDDLLFEAFARFRLQNQFHH